MRHYEIVFLVHPDQSEQVPAMVDRYRSMVEKGGGEVHRLENWGRRQLAHSIAKLHKAHYVLMNIECGDDVLGEILGAFRFSDAVLRHLVIRRDEAITEPSLLAKSDEGEADSSEAAAADARGDDYDRFAESAGSAAPAPQGDAESAGSDAPAPQGDAESAGSDASAPQGDAESPPEPDAAEPVADEPDVPSAAAGGE